MKKSIYIIILVLSITIMGSACKKLITVPLPNDLLVSSSVFVDSVTAQSAMNGLYSRFYNGYMGGSGYYSYNITLHPARLADEQYSVSNTADHFNNNSLVASNFEVEALWNDSYTCIYTANSIIQGVQASTTLSSKLKQQLTAESRFIRAVCYFYLSNYFGDVPLITSTNAAQISMLPASPAAQAYELMEQDLRAAVNTLAGDYSWSQGDRTRANKWAASAMLARVYLYMGKWPEAELEASKVIDQSGLYGLVTENLSDVFLKGSKETILEFYTNFSGFPYQNQHTNLTENTIPNFALRNELLQAFESNDQRRSKWISSINYNGSTYSYPIKYKSTINTNTEYQVFIRLSELMLIRSEARAQQNNFSGAKLDLDAIRDRAGLNGTSATDLPTFKTALEKERQTELFLEWGDRWLNLKRTGRADAVLKVVKPGTWQLTDVLYPIPISAISTNNNLKQNPGYK